MSKILCIEDSPEFFIYLTSVLRGHSLVQAPSISSAFSLVQNGRESFDLILLDVVLPDGNGIKILPQIRECFPSKIVPIIVLSTDNDVLSKVAAFGIGADDYISKPPDPTELRARIEAKIRSANHQSVAQSRLTYGDLSLDADRMSVELKSVDLKSESLELTPSEFKILKLLLGHPGHVYSRDQLMDHVWGITKYVAPRTVDAHISHLRKKLARSSVQIETVLSMGYKASLKSTSSGGEN